MSTLYETDICAWSCEQAYFLKRKDFLHLDIENIAEEIESLSKVHKRALKSQLKRLLMHLLKLRYQPEMQSDPTSWNRSIYQARADIDDLIEGSPSLKNFICEIIPITYESSRRDAAFETCLDLRVFPKECPWSLEEILNTK